MKRGHESEGSTTLDERVFLICVQAQLTGPLLGRAAWATCRFTGRSAPCVSILGTCYTNPSQSAPRLHPEQLQAARVAAWGGDLALLSPLAPLAGDRRTIHRNNGKIGKPAASGAQCVPVLLKRSLNVSVRIRDRAAYAPEGTQV